MALMKEELWGIVEETEVPPAVDATDAVKNKYAARKAKALATIVLSIETSLLYLVGEPTNPVDVWKQLRDQFQQKTWANKLLLRRQLHSLRLKEGDSIQGHIKKMTELFNELAAIGDVIDKDNRVVHVLASLPESYDTLVMALEASEKVPSMEIVVDHLLYEEKKVKELSGTGQDEEALTIKSKEKRIRCYYCGKLGHMQKDCYKKDPSRKNDGKRRPSKHDKSNGKKPDETSIGLVVSVHALAADNKDETQKWIIDSGATCHICGNGAMFDSMEDLNVPQIVTLGDGRNIQATKQGTIGVMLKQPDGSHRHATLHSVLYVPQLAYNLLSVTRITELVILQSLRER